MCKIVARNWRHMLSKRFFFGIYSFMSICVRIVLTNTHTHTHLIFSEHKKGLKLEGEQQIEERYQEQFHLWFKQHVSIIFYDVNIIK